MIARMVSEAFNTWVRSMDLHAAVTLLDEGLERNVYRQMVEHWMKKGVHHTAVLEVEAVTGIDRRVLRPDVFLTPAGRESA